MQYLVLPYVNEARWSEMTETEREQGLAAYGAYAAALQQEGILQGSNRLQPVAASTTIRIVDGRTRVLDGPYADTKEQIGGYFLIDVPDLDAAIARAARCPAAGHGVVELRPIWAM